MKGGRKGVDERGKEGNRWKREGRGSLKEGRKEIVEKGEI